MTKLSSGEVEKVRNSILSFRYKFYLEFYSDQRLEKAAFILFSVTSVGMVVGKSFQWGVES